MRNEGHAAKPDEPRHPVMLRQESQSLEILHGTVFGKRRFTNGANATRGCWWIHVNGGLSWRRYLAGLTAIGDDDDENENVR